MSKELSVIEILDGISKDHDAEMCNLIKVSAQMSQKDSGKTLGGEIVTLLETRYATNREASDQRLPRD